MKQAETVNNKRRYGFAKPSLVRIFSLIDGIGGALVRPFRRRGAWPDPQRIALVNFAHIGDVLLTTPAIAAIRSRYPHAHLTMVVAPWSEAVVAHNPRLDDVIAYRPSWWDRSRGSPYFIPSEFWALVQLVRHQRCDWVISFKSFFQENLAFALAGVPRRIGYGLYGGGFLQTDLVPFKWEAHTVLQHLALCAAVDAPASTLKLEMFVAPEDERAADALIGTARRPLIAMHVGAGYPSKLWPIDRYAELANRLAEQHAATIVFVGGNDDLPLIERLPIDLRAPHIIAAGRLSVPQTAALITRCVAFVGNDSGPAHIAAAVGTPAVVIFSGENDVSRWKPWGDPVLALQHLPECGLCGLKVCNRDHVCMTSISVEQVQAAVSGVVGWSTR